MEIQMTTLQAVFGPFAHRKSETRDHKRLWAIARTALGIFILATVLAAALAIRVLVYVHL